MQNFVIPTGDTRDVVFMSEASGVSLADGTAIWQAFTQISGVPDLDSGSLVIAKDSGTGGIDIMISPEEFVLHLMPSDTIGLLGNFYHELRFVDINGNVYTAARGIMTVTATYVSA